MVGRIEGKVALITGGASGIGRGCAERLAAEGAIVVISDLQEDLGQSVADGIRASGGKCEFIQHDVAEEESWVAVVAAIKARHGRLDVLVNNAGITAIGNIFEMTLKDWQRQSAVNLDSVFLGVKHAVPLMRVSGDGGSVINMSSAAGLKGSPNSPAYCATKGGVRLFSKAIALRCAQDKIRVNSVHPGVVDTPIWDQVEGYFNPDGNGPPAVEVMTQRAVPLGQKVLPLDIANGVLWLASDESRYFTGAELVIDGGMTIV